MKTKLANLYWGLILIVAGGITLAQTRGYLTDVDPLIWIMVYVGVSIASLVIYVLNGIENWALLFPAGIFAALALLVTMAINGINHPAMTAPLFVSIGLPFVMAYLLNRSRNWWALIPAGIMAFLACAMLVVQDLGGEIIGAGLFFALAATFALIYHARRMLWAALAAYGLFVMGFMPLMAMGPRPELAGIIMLFALALPFALVYLRSPDAKWWALIPAGILGTASVLAAVVLLPGLPGHGYDDRPLNALMYAGIGITFAVVWLRHHKPWALLFTSGAALLAVVQFFVGNLAQVWPLLIILAGCYLLYAAMRPRGEEVRG